MTFFYCTNSLLISFFSFRKIFHLSIPILPYYTQFLSILLIASYLFSLLVIYFILYSLTCFFHSVPFLHLYFPILPFTLCLLSFLCSFPSSLFTDRFHCSLFLPFLLAFSCPFLILLSILVFISVCLSTGSLLLANTLNSCNTFQNVFTLYRKYSPISPFLFPVRNYTNCFFHLLLLISIQTFPSCQEIHEQSFLHSVPCYSKDAICPVTLSSLHIICHFVTI